MVRKLWLWTCMKACELTGGGVVRAFSNFETLTVVLEFLTDIREFLWL